MSLRPAAVTSGPLRPGDDQRIGVVARGREHELVVRALDGGGLVVGTWRRPTAIFDGVTVAT
jgi:hypothetical protein